MNGEDGGKPHVTLGERPDPDQKVDGVWVLVAVQPDGGEGIYGAKIGEFIRTFCVHDLDVKDGAEKYLRGVGSIEVCRREGVKLEWRRMESVGEPEVIT